MPRAESDGSVWAPFGRVLRLCGRLSFGLLPLLFAALPFTAWRGVPGHDLLGGMFVELSFWQVFLVVAPLILCSWSAMTVLGLMVEGSKFDAREDPWGDSRVLPAWAEFFSLPPKPWTFIIFALVGAGPGAVVIVVVSGRLVTALAAVLAAAAAYLVAVLVTVPLSSAEPGYRVLPGPPAAAFASWLAKRPRFVTVVDRLRAGATMLVRRPPFDGALDGDGKRIDIDHFVAMGLALATFAVFLIEAWIFRPWEYDRSLPSAAVLFTLGTFLVWGLGAFTFHLRRYTLAPVLILLLAAVVGARLSHYDHHFHVTRRPTPSDAPSPADVVRPVGENLVVVTATGGGILAAGWTTLALERLILARPQLRQEIRLISAVSGGAVGAAFYTNRVPDLLAAGDDRAKLRAVLDDLHADSIKSSLDAVAYGLVYRDMPRFLSADLLYSTTDMDRGSLLERRWREMGGKPNVSLHSLAPAVRAGGLPATIFNATAMETGRRVMITPLVFDQGPEFRALTLDEYLLGPEPPDPAETRPRQLADLDFWTAARLSATFPFVTPAARAMIDQQLQPGRAGHHMIDGGYNDNYGVASALDFLRPVMERRQPESLTFKRLLIIQLRSFSTSSQPPEPKSGVEAALIGPLVGILSVRDGATLPRNQAALHEFIRRWQGVDGVAIETLIFEPAATTQDSGIDGEEPNSWHLSQAHKQALVHRWDHQPRLRQNLDELKRFLEGIPTP